METGIVQMGKGELMMPDKEKVIKALEIHINDSVGCGDCAYKNDGLCVTVLLTDALVLLKEQEEKIENLKQTAVKPIIDEYGKAYCVCGENVGIIPNNKNLPSVFAKYCPECGRMMKWK